MSKALGSGSQWTRRGLNAPSSTEPFTLPPARKRAAGRDQRSALRGHSPLCTVAASSPRARPPAYALLGPRVPARTEPEPGKYLWAEPRIAQPGLRDPGRLGPGPVQQVWAGPPVPARRLRASPGARGAPSQAGPGPVGRVSFHHPQSMRARVHITLPPPLLGSFRNSEASVCESWHSRLGGPGRAAARPAGQPGAGGPTPAPRPRPATPPRPRGHLTGSGMETGSTGNK